MEASSSRPPWPTNFHLLSTEPNNLSPEHSCFSNPNMAAEPYHSYIAISAKEWDMEATTDVWNHKFSRTTLSNRTKIAAGFTIYQNLLLDHYSHIVNPITKNLNSGLPQKGFTIHSSSSPSPPGSRTVPIHPEKQGPQPHPACGIKKPPTDLITSKNQAKTTPAQGQFTSGMQQHPTAMKVPKQPPSTILIRFIQPKKHQINSKVP
ncbi:hypothetical protein Nepgr_033659 [Nepenthes gracilis]|uniref:Uncharacterized protein n=1 Tax=Nepenthes gracilis TaxID=150966 RepID=A0AAD3Y8J2_NEPGR|nr:hypothetical protein Nepgr_033659 [Nepenthes gracilis]